MYHSMIFPVNDRTQSKEMIVMADIIIIGAEPAGLSEWINTAM